MLVLSWNKASKLSLVLLSFVWSAEGFSTLSCRRYSSHGEHCRHRSMDVTSTSSCHHHRHHHQFKPLLGIPPSRLFSATNTEGDGELIPEPSSSSLPDTPLRSSNTLLDRPLLAVLDLIALIVFAAIGKASHAAGEGTSILEETAAVALTALPFMVSWLASSFFTGVYQDIHKDDGWLMASWKQTAKGWIVAIPLGCVGRGLIKGYVPPAPFVMVTMIATLVILGVTRSVYHFLTVAKR
jgi:hypothetical protein